ncbi:MAG: flagellar protein FlaG [Deltaproteobacteria bacterium]|nr:flagellar protein FlaG [Deltaproteobacteria bacterium]MBW2073146.1 flagellar protein FlaG [Deltaproteobacteria bacterium]
MLVEPISVPKPQMDPTSAVGPKSKGPDPPKEPERSPVKKEEKIEDAEFLQDMLEVAQKHFNVQNIGLEFAVDGGTGRIKVTVLDKETGEIVREVPPQQVLDLMAKIDEMMGILFDHRA